MTVSGLPPFWHARQVLGQAKTPDDIHRMKFKLLIYSLALVFAGAISLAVAAISWVHSHFPGFSAGSAKPDALPTWGPRSRSFVTRNSNMVSIHDLILQADEALYRAKNMGRNRVEGLK